VNSAPKSAPRWVYGWVIALGCLALLYLLRGVLAPVFIAFGLAYVLDPLVDRLEVRRVPRAAGIAILLVPALVAIALVLFLVLPAVVRDVSVLLGELPQAVTQLLQGVQPWLAQHGVALPRSSSEALAALQNNIEQLAPDAVDLAQSAMSALLGGTVSAVGTAAAVLTVPVLTFYLLKDFDAIVAAAVALLPASMRERTVQMGREVDAVLGDFVRGQLMVMAILGTLYAIGYSLVGVRLAIPIGIIAGLLSFIPYVGGGVAITLALLMSVLHWSGIGQLALVGLVYATVQVLEGFVIVPRVVGDKLGLPPVLVLLALMIGGDLFGFAGVMLALPAAAVAGVFIAHGLRRYRASPLFLGEAPARPVVVVVHEARRGRLRPRRLRRKLRAPKAASRRVRS
jgi:predicted PurR-regulated permease PerM